MVNRLVIHIGSLLSLAVFFRNYDWSVRFLYFSSQPLANKKAFSEIGTGQDVMSFGHWQEAASCYRVTLNKPTCSMVYNEVDTHHLSLKGDDA